MQSLFGLMNRKTSRSCRVVLAYVLSLAMLLSSGISFRFSFASAAAKPKIAKVITMTNGQTGLLPVTGPKFKWVSVTSANKKIVKATKKGKVTALKIGTCKIKITVKYKKKKKAKKYTKAKLSTTIIVLSPQITRAPARPVQVTSTPEPLNTDSPEPGIIPTIIPIDPTDAPTAKPTAVPTAKPTAVPTVEPTAVPTAEPTVEPTAVPTPEPTAEPTAVPTMEPTAVPTPEPTAVPTPEPTTVPTPEPTAVPTPEPTAVPTPEPTPEPTMEPLPTAIPNPTVAPTAVPTAEPTAVPTAEPTAVPTPEPTAVPTAEPTAVPTPEPTAVPTPEPTAAPTPIPTPVPYTITYDLDGGTLSGTNPTTYTSGTNSFSLYNPTKEDYTFLGWTGTGLTEPTKSVSIPKGSEGNRTYTANFVKTYYTITYDLDGGTDNKNRTSYIYNNSAFNLIQPSKAGYRFDGWTGTDLTELTKSVTIPANNRKDLSFTAHWSPVSYTAKCFGNYGLIDGESIVSYPFTVESETFTLPTPVRPGYEFEGWVHSNYKEMEEPVKSYQIEKGTTESVTLVAQWKVASGATIAYLHFSDTDNEFEEVYNLAHTWPTESGMLPPGVLGTTCDVSDTSTSLKTVSLDFSNTPNKTAGHLQFLDLEIANGETAYPNSWIEVTGIFINDESVPFNPGYTLCEDEAGTTRINIYNPWVDEIKEGRVGPSATSYTEKMIADSVCYQNIKRVSVVFKFHQDDAISIAKLNKASISYNLDGGTVSGTNPTNYDAETATFTLKNPTRTGYTFAGWTGTDLTTPTKTVTITKGDVKNRSYTANWTAIDYNITYNLAGGALPTGKSNPSTYTVADAITLVNPVRTGFNFLGWSTSPEESSPINSTYSIAKGTTGAKTLYAHWAFNTSAPYAFLRYTSTGDTPNNCFDLTDFPASDTTLPAGITTSLTEINTLSDTTGTLTYDFTGTTDKNGGFIEFLDLEISDGEARFPNSWIEITSLTINGESISYLPGYTTSDDEKTTRINIYNPWVDKLAGRVGPSATSYTEKMIAESVRDIKVKTLSVGFTFHRTGSITLAKATKGTISYNLNGGTTTYANPTSYDGETRTFSLYTPKKNGYTFDGWTGTDLTEPTKSVTIEKGDVKDRSYTANWSVTNNSIYYLLNDGSLPTGMKNPSSYTIEDDTITLINPERPGFDFLGWTTSDNGNETPKKTMTIEKGSYDSKFFYAQWTLKKDANVAYLHFSDTDNEYEEAYDNTHWPQSTDFLQNGVRAYTKEISSTKDITTGSVSLYFSGTPHSTAGHLQFLDLEISNGESISTDSWIEITGVNINNSKVDFTPGYTMSEDAKTTRINIYNSWVDKITEGRVGPSTTEYSAKMISDEVCNQNIRQVNVSFIYHKTGGVDINTLNKGTISYDLAGGTVSGTNPTTYDATTASFTLKNPTKAGYTFAGWTGTDLTTPTKTVTITKGDVKNRSYTANWTPITYTIKCVSDDITIPDVNYTVEDSFTLDIPVRPGFEFLGWTTTNSSAATPVKNYTIAKGTRSNTTLYAQWQLKTGANVAYLHFSDTNNVYEEAYDNTRWPQLTNYLQSGVKATTKEISSTASTTSGTVSLDFTGTPHGTAGHMQFLDLEVSNGEINFPNSWIEITSVKINGSSVGFTNGYTLSEDEKTTRINIYNSWVDDITEGRIQSGITGYSATIIPSSATTQNIKTINVSFIFHKTGGVAITPAPTTGTISYDLAGGTVSGTNPTTYDSNTASFTLKNPTRAGFTFAGWTGTDLTTPTKTVTITKGDVKDRSYTANWTYKSTSPVAYLHYSSNGNTPTNAYSILNYPATGSLPTGVTSTLADISTSVDTTATVSLDFTKTKDTNGGYIDFLDVEIANGEANFPNSWIEITSLKINGSSVSYTPGYTTADDGKTTRINIYNKYVTEVTEGRIGSGTTGYSAQMINSSARSTLVKTIAVTFKFHRTGGVDLAAPVTSAYLHYASTGNTPNNCFGIYDYPSTVPSGVTGTTVGISDKADTTGTASFDFTNTTDGNGGYIDFLDVEVADGESLFPDSWIEITGIKINGSSVSYTPGYTTSDDGETTRINIYNKWVSEVTEGRIGPGTTSYSAQMINSSARSILVKKVEVSFIFHRTGASNIAPATPTNYSITYKLNGGSLPSGKTNPTTYNSESGLLQLNNPVKDGYVFDGWVGAETDPDNPDSTNAHIPVNMNQDLVIEATWKPALYAYLHFSDTSNPHGESYDNTNWMSGSGSLPKNMQASTTLLSGTDGEVATSTLDFTNTTYGSVGYIQFLDLEVLNGETFYPNSWIEITDIKINGSSVSFSPGYTTAEKSSTTTRVNIYNSWQSGVSNGRAGSTSGTHTPTMISSLTCRQYIKTIQVTYKYHTSGAVTVTK